MNTSLNFNNRIIKLWKENLNVLSHWYEGKEILAPMLYPELTKNSLLTIGINPSFSPKKITNQLKKFPPKGMEKILGSVCSKTAFDVYEHYRFNNRELNTKNWVEFEGNARKKYIYYQKFRLLTNELNLQWNHIDLYYIRDTKQRDFLGTLEKYPEFKKKQIDLTKHIIITIKPKIILVANAKAAEEYKREFDITDEKNWIEEKGCYYTDLDGEIIPTHFSGQLTYLDTESFKRLKWVMKNSVK